MKKGLSVLLIAALLFGFYGGAVNLNDILACKDYWEEAGEKSTADMNKLEDGLNQLKDNEQAYLDGLDQVAQGEKDLAQGEADYAAGQAQLAKGEADYAAAPGKLAAARKQIAQGEDDLAEGKSQLDGLTTLINYLSDVEAKYNAWKPKYEALKTARGKVKAALADNSDFSALANYIPDAQAKGSFNAMLGMLAADDVTGYMGTTADTAPDEIVYLNVVGGVYNNASNIVGTLEDNASKAAAIQEKLTKYAENKEGVKAYFTPIIAATINGLTNNNVATNVERVSNAETDVDVDSTDLTTIASALGQTKNALESAAEAEGVSTALNALGAFYQSYYSGVEAGKLSSSIIKGELAGADGGEGYMATVMQGVAKNVLGNKTLKDAVESKMGATGIALLNYLKSDALFPKSDDYPNGTTFGAFAYQMEQTPGILGALKQAKALLVQARSEGQKTYNAGAKKLAAGKKQYAQGLADYKAAPGKLADGRQQLAEGLQALMDGRAQLAAGKDKLAQYEDGEQQVRDGLATLVGTEADLELESILDRLNGDSDFDNGDNHLELDEGLAAVDVGRGYQAEDGELITKEIMTRAIGTGGLLAAGVLAVLAAILSFMKKNKGAGVLAILSAVAGAFGAYEATQAGTYFSSIAGSTVGQTGMIAAGILAAVALVHSIAHFTAKKEA